MGDLPRRLGGHERLEHRHHERHGGVHGFGLEPVVHGRFARRLRDVPVFAARGGGHGRRRSSARFATMPQSKPITTLVVVSRRLPVTSSPESTKVQNAPPQNIRVVQSRIVSITFLRCENGGVALTALLAREERIKTLGSLATVLDRKSTRLNSSH